MPVPTETTPDAAEVLTKALLRAANRLGLSQRTLAAVIGLNPASVSRLGRGRTLTPGTKEAELAMLLLRLFRTLDALVGGNEIKARAWLEADNTHLGGVPADRILSIEGLVDVVGYLDGLLGKLSDVT